MMQLEPFGIATVAGDLEAAREFYTQLYPYPVIDAVVGSLRSLSIMKHGVALVKVFQKARENPMRGTIPILRVDSVKQYVETVAGLGGSVIIGQTFCPCSNANWALCADTEGNQFIIMEGATTVV